MEKFALQIIQFVLNLDLHKEGVFKHISNILLDKINLTNSVCHNLDVKNYF